MLKVIYKNLPNIVSILGVLPVFILLMEGGFNYLIPLILYNNIMDDLDGILAVKLDLKSNFGAVLDNVCDAVTHTIFVMAVGFHFGGLCAVAGMAATVGILFRVVSRLTTPSLTEKGSPTNELIRHLVLLLLLAEVFAFDPFLLLVTTFVLHTTSMLAPFPMPYMIRSLSKSATCISLVNLSLLLAWLAPMATPMIATCFLTAYLYAFFMGALKWLK